MSDAPSHARAEVLALRAAAEADVDELTRRIADLTAARVGDNSDDEHDPEGSTLAFERSQAEALLAAARRRRADAERAVDRLADGSYGRCAVCGRPIAPARLAARPLTDRCIAHA